MTDEATTARRLAINFEGIKYAFRQSKEGIVISFVVHPQQVPDGLAVAALGTRYIVALVELGDDETPRPPKRKEVTTKPRPYSPSQGGARSKSFNEMSPVNQAGMLSADPMFQKFMKEYSASEKWPDDAKSAEETTAAYIRRYCNVISRSDITANNRNWKNIVSDYRTWMRKPAIVPYD